MSDVEIEKIRQIRKLLGNPYACLYDMGGYSAVLAEPRKHNVPAPSRFYLENPYAYLTGEGKIDGRSGVITVPKEDIEKSRIPNIPRWSFRGKPADAARALHKEIWRNRRVLWPDGVPENPVDMLDPEIAIRCLGYDIFLDETLGQYRIGGVKNRGGRHDRPGSEGGAHFQAVALCHTAFYYST